MITNVLPPFYGSQCISFVHGILSAKYLLPLLAKTDGRDLSAIAELIFAVLKNRGTFRFLSLRLLDGITVVC